MNKINEFKNEYAFLSNFYPCKVNILGRTYPSAEHAYQALKTNDMAKRQEIANAPTAKEAKAIGRKLTLRPNWDNERLPIMDLVVTAKFHQNSDLKKKLVDTGDAELIEGNYWRDNFWGVFQGKGENNLGKVLMGVRKAFAPALQVTVPAPVKQIEKQLFGLYYDGKFLKSYRTENFVNGARTQRAKARKLDLDKFEIIKYNKV